jgi:hypothetical protein
MRRANSLEFALTAWVVMAALFSVWRALTQATTPLAYNGTPGVSAALASPAETGDSLLSRGEPAPRPNAARTELMDWLRQHYPAMSLSAHEAARPHERDGIDLGGGPPRDVWVLPGRGLVLREPRSE